MIRGGHLGPDVRIYEPVNIYDSVIRAGTTIGPFVEIGGASIGRRCKIQSHSYICAGVEIFDDVFIGHGVMFCNPGESPVLMADLSFRQIGDLDVGDEVMGWEKRVYPHGRFSFFVTSRVEVVIRRSAPLVRLSMASGREIRCTADHYWLTVNSPGQAHRHGGEWFAQPRVGRDLAHIADSVQPLGGAMVRDAAWLAGMFDGEGSASLGQALQIGQSRKHNPANCAELERVLDRLGFNWTYEGRDYDRGHNGSYRLSSKQGSRFAGCRQLYIDFANKVQPVTRAKIVTKFMQMKRQTADRIVAVTSDGSGEVVALTTATGNYVCHGYASKNCNDRYPRTCGDWTLEETFVEDEATIGTGAVILPGVRIGEGAMVGAGAVVTSDVGRGETVVGNPARRI